MRPPSLKAADFQRALGSRPVARTAHFVLHILPRSTQAGRAAAPAEPAVGMAADADLSTSDTASRPALVDDPDRPVSEIQPQVPATWRLGLVLPKKQARRSVTRSLIRHQAREALRRHAPAVWAVGASGHVDGWVLRLKAPFDRQQFPSAASDALRRVVRQELDELWAALTAPASKGGRNGPRLHTAAGAASRGAA